MNKQLLKKVRDHIANEDTGFDMGFYAKPCGTVACIAGWTLILLGWTAEEIIEMTSPCYAAGQALGLDRDTATSLFFGEWADGMATTRAQAVAKLDEMLA